MAATAGAIRAGRAFIELFTDNRRLISGLRNAQRRLRSFGLGVAAIGGALTGLGVVVLAPLLIAVKKFAAVGDQLNKMAARTGISTRALSELGFAAEQSGSDLEAVEKAVRKMQQTIGEAADGMATYVDELTKLGLTVEDLLALSPDQQFELIADRISKIEDPTLRVASAMAIFGRAGTAMLPMLADGAEGITALRKEAQELGLSISEEQAQAAADFTDAWNRIKRIAKATIFVIGGQLAPLMTSLFEKIKPIAKAINDWAIVNKKAIKTIFGVALAVTAAGIVITGIGLSIVLLGAVLGGVATILNAIGTAFALLTSPITLAIAAIIGFGAFLLTTTEEGGKALEWFGDQFSALFDAAKETWAAIANAIAAGNLEAAMKVVTTTIKLVWLKLKTWLVETWEGFKLFWSDLTTGIASAMINIVAKIRMAWAGLIGWMQKAWEKWKLSTFEEGLADLLAPIFARLQGVSVEATRKALREDFERGRKALPDRLKAIDKETEADQARIEAERKATNKLLREGKTRAELAAGKKIAAAQEALELARKSRDIAIEEAEAARAPERAPGEAAPKLAEAIAGTQKEQADRVAGTFSAFAASRFGGSTRILTRVAVAAERGADATEEQNELNKRRPEAVWLKGF